MSRDLLFENYFASRAVFCHVFGCVPHFPDCSNTFREMGNQIFVQIVRPFISNASFDQLTVPGRLTPERVNDIAKNSGIMKRLISLVCHTLPRLAKSAEATEMLDNIKQLCLVAKINAFSPRSLMPQDGLRKVGGNSGIELLELCFDMDLLAEAGQALDRFLVAPPANDALYIEHGLIPLLKELPHFLYTHHSSLKCTPFSTFAADVITKFVRYVLPPKPSHTIPSAELEATGCRCTWCTKRLVPFMINTEESLRVTTCSIHHVEDRLKRTKKWDFTWKRNDIHDGLLTASSISASPNCSHPNGCLDIQTAAYG